MFPALALLSLAVFRRPLLEWLRGRDADAVDSLVGEIAVPADTIEPGAHGRAELRGSTWTDSRFEDRGERMIGPFCPPPASAAEIS